MTYSIIGIDITKILFFTTLFLYIGQRALRIIIILLGITTSVIAFKSDPRAFNYFFFFIVTAFSYMIVNYLIAKFQNHLIIIIHKNKIGKPTDIKKYIDSKLNLYRSLILSLFFFIFFFLISKFLFFLFSTIWIALFLLYWIFKNYLKSDHILIMGIVILVVFFLIIDYDSNKIWSDLANDYKILSFTISLLVFRYWLAEITRIINFYLRVISLKSIINISI